MSRERGVLFQPDMVRAVTRATNPKRITRRLHKLGDVGDVLWGREAWRTDAIYNNFPPREVPVGGPIRYETDGVIEPVTWRDVQKPEDFGKLRPSMFMCRWMSRIDLRLVEVSDEPLQHITESDAILEGAEPYDVAGMSYAERILLDAPLLDEDTPYRNGFALLWERIQGPGSWFANPTVFRHVFERVK